MSIGSHIACGMIITKFLEAKGLIPAAQLDLYYLVGAVSSSIPDIDGLLFNKIYDHRTNSPFHYPVTWWILSITAIVLAVAQRERMFLPFIYFSTLCVIFHLFIDTFGVNAGICWLKPFTKVEYSFLPIRHGKPTNIKEWLLNYYKSPLMFIEIVFITTGIILLFIR